MNILVTGGTGFLGQWVCRELTARGEHPIAVGSEVFDLRRQQDVEDLFDETRPQIVYHLAGDVGGITANQNTPADFWYNNLMMGLNVLDECRRHDEVQKLIIVGTVCSYPEYPGLPFVEESLWDGYPEPTNAAYGIAKRALLTGAEAYRQQYGLNTIFLIPANLYGPGDHFGEGGHVIAEMIHKFHTQQNVQLLGDGAASRDFLYVEDAAHGIVQAAQLYNGSWPVNLGTGVETKIKDLAWKIRQLTEHSGAVTFDDTSPNGQEVRMLDTTRAKALFDWEASTPLELGLQDTIEWYRKVSEYTPILN